MSVSRLSRLEDIDNKRPGHRVQNWMRAYGWVHQTFATETKTEPSRYRWTRSVTWQPACRWTQENPSDTTNWESHFVQIRCFLTKSGALFARSALQNDNFKTTYCLWFSTGVISVYVVRSLTTAVVAEHPASQQVENLVCVTTHTFLNEIDEDNQTRTEKSNSWMCRKTLHARRRQWWCTSSRILQEFAAVLFTTVSWHWSGWQRHFRVPTEEEIVNGWMQGHMPCQKQKQARTSRSNPVHPLDWAGRVFLLILSSGSRMLAHLSQSQLETCFRHSLVHLPRRCHLGSHFARRTMHRVFRPWGSILGTLLSDGRDVPPRFPESLLLVSAYRCREKCQLDVSGRSDLRWLSTQRYENKTHSRSLCFKSHVES